VTDCTETCP